MSDFYGDLKRPLKLVEVAPVGENRFHARYNFETRDGRVCDGSAVTTQRVGDLNLILGIGSDTGC
jgi:hypothetical protein